MDVDVDFVRDYQNGAWLLLRRCGYDLPVPITGDRVAMAIVNLQLRSIPVRPRQVFRSRELLARNLTSAEATAIARIEMSMIAGLELGPFLSTLMLDAEFRDRLLFDWGISHFHLDLPTGRPAKSPGFARRTKQLLFAYVVDDAAYLVDLRDHDSFEDDALVQIIHNNWPEVIRHGRAGFSDHALSIESRRRLRRGGINAIVVMPDGVAYMALGGGYASSGTSIVARMQVDRRYEELLALEQTLRANASGIADAIQTDRGDRPSRLRLELRLHGDIFNHGRTLHELESGQELQVNIVEAPNELADQDSLRE